MKLPHEIITELLAFLNNAKRTREKLSNEGKISEKCPEKSNNTTPSEGIQESQNSKSYENNESISDKKQVQLNEIVNKLPTTKQLLGKDFMEFLIEKNLAKILNPSHVRIFDQDVEVLPLLKAFLIPNSNVSKIEPIIKRIINLIPDKYKLNKKLEVLLVKNNTTQPKESGKSDETEVKNASSYNKWINIF